MRSLPDSMARQTLVQPDFFIRYSISSSTLSADLGLQTRPWVRYILQKLHRLGQLLEDKIGRQGATSSKMFFCNKKYFLRSAKCQAGKGKSSSLLLYSFF